MISSYALRVLTLSLLLLATADRAYGAPHPSVTIPDAVPRSGSGSDPDSLRLRQAVPGLAVRLLVLAGETPVDLPPPGEPIQPVPVLLLSDDHAAQPLLLTAPRNHTVRSAGALGAAGVAVFGIIWMMPAEVSKWDKTAGPEGFRPGWSAFKQAYTRPPVWDEDGWLVNYVAHPVVGMQTYLLERNYGGSPTRAFLFSTAASVGWEYLIESWAERPSTQDLLVTSTVGSLLGEASYQATQRLRRGGLSKHQKVVLTVINPVHVLQHGYR